MKLKKRLFLLPLFALLLSGCNSLLGGDEEEPSSPTALPPSQTPVETTTYIPPSQPTQPTTSPEPGADLADYSNTLTTESKFKTAILTNETFEIGFSYKNSTNCDVTARKFGDANRSFDLYRVSEVTSVYQIVAYGNPGDSAIFNFYSPQGTQLLSLTFKIVDPSDTNLILYSELPLYELQEGVNEEVLYIAYPDFETRQITIKDLSVSEATETSFKFGFVKKLEITGESLGYYERSFPIELNANPRFTLRQMPFKDNYLLNEPIDLTGLIVWDNNNDDIVPLDYIYLSSYWAPYNPGNGIYITVDIFGDTETYLYQYTNYGYCIVSIETNRPVIEPGISPDLGEFLLTVIYSNNHEETINLNHPDVEHSPIDTANLGSFTYDFTYRGYSGTGNYVVSYIYFELYTSPNKTIYNEGESFDPSGLVINCIYEAVNHYVYGDDPLLSFSPTVLRATDNQVDVYYKGRYALSIPVTVNPVESQVVGIQTSQLPYKTQYNLDEQIDFDGLVVELILSNGSTRIANYIEDYTIDAYDTSTPGYKNIIIRYTQDSGINTFFRIQVVVEPSFSVDDSHFRFIYQDGQDIDFSGLSFTYYNELGRSSSISCNEVAFSTTVASFGQSSIHWEYQTFEGNLHIEVGQELTYSNHLEMSDIFIQPTSDRNTLNTVLINQIGFDCTISTVNAQGASVSQTFYGVTPLIKESTFTDNDFTVSGDHLVTVYYLDESNTESYHITVDGPASLEIGQLPRCEYTEGEVFDYVGLKLYVVNLSGTKTLLNKSQYTRPTDPLTLGTTKVTLGYRDLTIDLPITVHEKVLTGLNASLKTNVYLYTNSPVSLEHDFTYQYIYNGGQTYEYRETVSFEDINCDIETYGSESSQTMNFSLKDNPTITCQKTVNLLEGYVPVESVSISSETQRALALATTGKTLNLTATFNPDNASHKEVRFTSSDDSILSMTSNVKCVVRHAGTVNLTVTYLRNPELTQTLTINVCDASGLYPSTVGEYTKLTNSQSLNEADEIVILAGDATGYYTVNNEGSTYLIGSDDSSITLPDNTLKLTVHFVDSDQFTLQSQDGKYLYGESKNSFPLKTTLDDSCYFTLSNGVLKNTHSQRTLKFNSQSQTHVLRFYVENSTQNMYMVGFYVKHAS